MHVKSLFVILIAPRNNSFISCQIGTELIPCPPGGLFPAVGMHSDGEEVRLDLAACWVTKEPVYQNVGNQNDSLSKQKNRIQDEMNLASRARYERINIDGDQLR